MTASAKRQKNLLTRFLTLATMSLLCSCSQFMGPNRTFIDEMDQRSGSFFQAGRDFPVVPGDSGRAYRSREEIRERTPASGRTRQERRYQQSIRQEVQAKVDELSEREYNQYLGHRPYLESPSEKIYYFDLSAAERREYMRLKTRGQGGTLSQRSTGRGTRGLSEIRSVTRAPASRSYGQGMSYHESRNPEHSPLHLGMSKDEVINRWGRPRRVDVAGDPEKGNERWVFQIGGKVRQVYFNNGEVDGWSFK